MNDNSHARAYIILFLRAINENVCMIQIVIKYSKFYFSIHQREENNVKK